MELYFQMPTNMPLIPSNSETLLFCRIFPLGFFPKQESYFSGRDFFFPKFMTRYQIIILLKITAGALHHKNIMIIL